MLSMQHDSNNQQGEEPITDHTEHLQEEPDAESQQPAQQIYHVYVVKEPETEAEIPPFVHETLPTPKPKRHPVLLLVSVCIALVALLSGFATGSLLFMPTVTITLVPEQKTLTTMTTITLVSGIPQAAEEIPGRLLPVVTMSQQQTVKTTGKGYQKATFARGTITFYNAAPFSQFIPAGTLLVAANGNQIVTDQDALLPAADMPIVGQLSVAAHAVVAGRAGNMPEGLLESACCRANVFVKNATAFTGGQEARTYPMVTKQDVDSVAHALKTSLLQSMQMALQSQVTTHEALITPLPCTPIVSPNHPLGAEATELTVTVSQTCKPVAYETQALQIRLAEIQRQQSLTQLGAEFVLTSSPHPPITRVSHAKHGLMTLHIQATGTWAYQFTKEQLQKMTTQIAGKKREQAIALLLQVPGVNQVSMDRLTTVPADPGKIQLIVMAMGITTH